jgi:hypothetical protein
MNDRREMALGNIIKKRKQDIRQGSQRDSDRQLQVVLAAHGLTLDDVQELLSAKHMRKRDTQALIKTLQREQFADVRLKRTPGVPLSDEEREARRGRDRAKFVRSMVMAARLTGILGLCPLCELLAYRRTPQASGRVWHGPCWGVWRRSKTATRWWAERTQASRNGVPKAVLPKFPLPSQTDSAANVTGSELLTAYRTLMQFMSGRPRAVIAADQQLKSEVAITQRIKRFRKRLPATWSLVFPGRVAVNSNVAREQLYTLPRSEPNALSARQAAAVRMTKFGVPPAVITQVTGCYT